MPRVARGLADGQIYHVLNRGNGRQNVFHKEGDFQAFLRLLGETKERYGIKVFAYCLMSNHFHLLLQTEEGQELGRSMQWLMTSHVRRYHRHYGTSGHVWQGRYKSFIVQQDDHLLTVVRYIETNPVRAKMVDKAGDWPWSSYRERTVTGTGFEPSEMPVPFGGQTTADEQWDKVVGAGQAPLGPVPGVTLDPLPVSVTGDWAAFIGQPISAKEEAGLRQSFERQAPFGSETWKEKIGRLLGLESTMRPKGRPRKSLGK